MTRTLNKTMKAVVIDQFGGIETLKTREIPVPEVDADEVLVGGEVLGVGEQWRHRRRHPEVRASGEPGETRGEHAHHGQRPAVHADRAPDDSGVATEAAPPERIAEDHHVWPVKTIFRR